MDHTNIEHQIERRRKRRRGIIALLSALAALTLGAGSFSLAQFTSTRHVDLVVLGRHDRHRLEPAVVAAVTGMMPGDTVADASSIANLGNAARSAMR